MDNLVLLAIPRAPAGTRIGKKGQECDQKGRSMGKVFSGRVIVTEKAQLTLE